MEKDLIRLTGDDACPDGDICPNVYLTKRWTALVQGTEDSGGLTPRVVIPLTKLFEAMDRYAALPSKQASDNSELLSHGTLTVRDGDLFVTGVPARPEERGQIKVPAHENVVEVSFALLEEVHRAQRAGAA